MSGPGGPLPDFGDPTLLDHGTQGWKALVVIVVCTVLVTLFVGLRTYTRKVIINELWVDDYLAITANVLLLAQGIFEGIQVRDGVGTHLWDLLGDPEILINFNKENWIGFMIYNINSAFVKLMFFFQYYRIVRSIPHLKLMYIIIMSVIVLWCASQILINALTCIPIQGLWDPSVVAVCNPVGPQGQFYMTSIGNLITDVIILFLPMPVVWKLNLRRPQKLVLYVVFGLGFFTCIISAFRLIFLRRPVDFSYDAIDVLCWSHSELASGIICAAIPTLRPLLGKYFPAMGTMRQSSRGYRKYNQGSGGQDLASPRSTELSTKDTGIYGLQDLDVGVERPQPVRIDTHISVVSKHSKKASLPISVYNISSPASAVSRDREVHHDDQMHTFLRD